jgi:Na+-transporting methylmalonyl-CoA/oxaloacetate decarboxylase beta subunit
MESAVASGLQGLLLGITNLTVGHAIMLMIASALLYLGIKKGY